VEGLVAPSLYGGYSLTPANGILLEGNNLIEAPGRRGSVPAHIRVTEKSTYSWRIYVDSAQSVYADVSYSFQQEKSRGRLSIRSEAGNLNAGFEHTGLYVGEPDSNWHIESFNSHRLGQLKFPAPGYYTITLEVKPGRNEELAFQWIWLEQD
jgi:alpha-L-fucosidase